MNAFRSITTKSRSSLVATFCYTTHVSFITTGLIIEACNVPAHGQKKITEQPLERNCMPV